MHKKILIIEDDTQMASLIRTSLVREGFDIRHSNDGISGLEMAKEEKPDLVILDLMLPGINGYKVCRKLRKDPKTAHTPIIILTAFAEEHQKVLGLELGADDYMTKPFSPRELLARVKAVIRRAGRAKDPDVATRLSYKTLDVDIEACTVKEKGRELVLTPKEFGLLVFLLKNKGRVMSREMILEGVWGLPGNLTTRTVDIHILSLRKKIALLGKSIVTVRQFGYKLEEG